MTRDEARNAWNASGLNYSHLTLGRLQKLRDMLNEEMKATGLMPTAARSGGTFRANARIFAGISSGGWCAALTCRAAHFKKREAITFGDNGFIGFAGWADDVNIQPILKAFVSWVQWMEEPEGEQPMETAPKDGTSFRAFDPAFGWVECHWYVHPSIQAWISDDIDCGWYEFSPITWKPAKKEHDNV